MNSEQRMQEMERRLREALSPTQLEIIDDSADHLGHAGASQGAGHYTVNIAAPSLAGKSRVQAHQSIYQPLHDLIPNEIHALCINILK